MPYLSYCYVVPNLIQIIEWVYLVYFNLKLPIQFTEQLIIFSFVIMEIPENLFLVVRNNN